MRIIHVVRSLDPAMGGPTRSVKGLCRALSLSGVDVTLWVLNGSHEFVNPCGVEVVYGGCPDFAKYDLAHVHGIWAMDNHKAVKACIAAGLPYVISPRGMLDPWSLSIKKWKKKLAMLLYQRRDLKRASALHATAQDECDHIRQLGFRQPIIIAPNGVEIPCVMPEKTWGDPVYSHTAIFLSRLHPGKGLLTLAEAWARVRPIGWQMLVVGPDSYGHKKDVIARINQLGIARDWQFVGELSDGKKWSAYRSADLLIHPSVSENFGITIAEGLAAGLPVIATKGTPWSDLEAKGCGWWVDVGVAPLEAALRKAMNISDMERRAMGVRGQKLVSEKYTWNAVADVMISGYKEILRCKRLT